MERAHQGVIGDEMFRFLVENVRDYAIFMLDPHGIVATWNAGAQQIKGYAKDEIIGQHFSVFYPPDAVARRWPQHELSVARDLGRFEDESWRVRKDGTMFWANVVITPMFDEEHRLLGFARITRDLTTRRQIEELRRTERQMTEFLAMLGHELRNPLSPIQSVLDVLERKSDDQAILAWAHAIIRRQTRQLARLVDDLVDVTRVTRGTIALKREPVDVNATLAEVVDSSRPLIDARHHFVDVSLHDGPLFVSADATRLAQVLWNLLGNAIKYTNDGGRIVVRTALEDDLVIVSIADNGIGMTADLVPRVFDLFVQGERGLDRREGGLGVGLTIAKHLIALQGGTLSAASSGPGLGSRFTVGFPLLSTAQIRGTRAHAGGSAAFIPRRVLVVDDNRDAAESLAALVELLGHRATVLYDGRDALGAAAAQRPDVMLLDIGLPGMDGFEVARRLRTIPGLEDVRLIACTGYGRDEDARKIGEAGFERHLVKPVSATDLERILAG